MCLGQSAQVTPSSMMQIKGFKSAFIHQTFFFLHHYSVQKKMFFEHRLNG